MDGSCDSAPSPSKSLADLLTDLPGLLTWPPPDVQVTGVAGDSRQIQPGNIFVARAGDSFDGHVFISDAVMSGATVVVGEEPAPEVFAPVPYLRVRDGREALAWLSAAWHGFPARHLTTVGVTGTDGKTTTVKLLYHILRAAGFKTGMISTVNAIIGDQTQDTGLHVTTPDATAVQQLLSQMVAAGVSHAILEATSHGLAQHRVTACDFDVGIITNVTHEHLDYHGDWESYLAAKLRLIEGLAPASRKPGARQLAVLNADDESFPHFLDLAPARVLSYGLEQEAVVTAREIVHTPAGLQLALHTRIDADGQPSRRGEGVEIPVTSPLMGVYNVYNVLAAATAALGLGISSEAIRTGVGALHGIPGRMERVSEPGHPFTAIVDFAHTPNALQKALQAARDLVADGGRVLAVWGSAGLRDREKRRLMGTVSAQLADITIITAEDPRTESLESILAESAAACAATGAVEERDFWRVADRGQALRFAVELAHPGDVVIACGKGHEQSMCFGTTEYAWDDREALRLALRGETLDTLPTAHRRQASVKEAS
jgi:UDP-N-acetylmuramoyl-L-alanyl-D-glutamate--2,6-diaminopimelate ligase